MLTEVPKTCSLDEYITAFRGKFNEHRLPYITELKRAGFNSFTFESNELYVEIAKWCNANLDRKDFQCYQYLTYNAIAFNDDAAMVCIKLLFGHKFDKVNGET